jgi:aminoglycoside phosphotransferase family enzyme/predicted kinase
VVPITASADGLRVDGSGEVVEWAVKMQRLPDDATFQERLRRGDIGKVEVTSLAHRIARFHADAAGGTHIAEFGCFEVVAGNARENFAQTASHIGLTVSQKVFDRLKELTEIELDRHRTLIERRAASGVPRDTHGDLHLDHVYLFPERTPPDDLVIIDCIEFNERFRFADPVADLAFAAMDFAYQGNHPFAKTLADAYFAERNDAEGRALLPFYAAYRAIVRAKVEGMQAFEEEVPAPAQHAARDRARAYWLLALSILESRDARPMLVLIGGLPGTGKSTLAKAISEARGFAIVRSDVVRKELSGIGPSASAQASFGQGIYSTAQTERTYDECLSRAEQHLFLGRRVIVDATLSAHHQRIKFAELARRLCVPIVFLECRASRDEIKVRLQNRRGDASDADWQIYEQASQHWEPCDEQLQAHLCPIDTGRSIDIVTADAIECLESHLISVD